MGDHVPSIHSESTSRDAAAARSAAASGVEPRKTWRVGTLTYTTAGLVVLFCWLLWGDFAWAMKERSAGGVLTLLLRKFGASDLLVSLFIVTLPQALTVVLNPIVSSMSDRHRGKWGRRIPFLLYPGLLAAGSMVALACSPALGVLLHHALGTKSPGLNFLVLFLFGAFWTLFEFGTVVGNNILHALINDVVPAPVLGRFYGLFRALNLLVGIAFFYWLFGHADKYFVPVFIGIGTLYGGGFTLMCLKVKEGNYPPPPPRAECSALAAVLAYLRESFAHPVYRWLFAYTTFGWMALFVASVFTILFAQSLHMDMGQYGRLIALTYVISFVLSYVLGALADRFHPLTVSLVAIGVDAVVLGVAGFTATNTTVFAIVLVTQGVLSGSWETLTSPVPARLFPAERFGQLFSAMKAINAVGIATASPLVGAFLDRAGHVYRYTYYVSCALAVGALVSGLLLFARFKALGGPKNYAPPR